MKLRLVLSGKWYPDAPSANVVGEIVGREKPEEIVLMGAHIDSWDVGQGAHDDGTGCAIVMQALTVLRKLGLKPRRTIRVVLFTNEENGLRGAFQYAEDHKSEVANHVMAMESDSGGFHPQGFSVQSKNPKVLKVTEQIVKLLEPIGANRARSGGSGADLIPLVRAGVPGMGLWVKGDQYFDYHHTAADTLDKVNAEHLAKNVAAVAVLVYVVAEMEARLGK